jgi:hypothetical protein
MILFNMSIGCTLIKDMKNINTRYYQYLHVYNINDTFELQFKTNIQTCVLFRIRANK